MQPIRLGVIGTGFAWERLHWPALQQLQDKYQVVALCDRERTKVLTAAGKIGLDPKHTYTDLDALLARDDLDAVDVIVPIPQNYEVSRAVAERGVHIICEKPLAPDLEQARRYLALSDEYPAKIMIAENYRYNEENNLIRGLIEGGEIGDVVFFMYADVTCFPCQMSQDTFAATDWRQHPDYAGGDFLDAALHNVAGMRHIFGAVEKVSAFGQPQHEDFSPYRSYHVNVAFKSGVMGQFAYWPSGEEPQRPLLGLRIFGTKGEIYLEERSCGIVNVAFPDGSSKQLPYMPERGYYNEFVNFYNALAGTEAISSTPEIEYGDVRMVFDILESIKGGGKPVAVDLEPQPAHA